MANLRNRNSRNRDDNAVSYRDGYVHGRVSERRLQEEGLEVRDNNNAARGLLIGIIITSVVGLVLAALFFWNQRQQDQTPVPATVPVVPASPAPAASQEQSKQTTVIERHTVQQVPVPVPQQAAPVTQPRVDVNVPAQPAPNVNVTVPNSSQQPASERSNTTINVNPGSTPSQTKSEKSSNSTSGQNSTRYENTTPGTSNNSGNGSTSNSNR